MLLAAMPDSVVDCHSEYVRDKKQETYPRKSYISNRSKSGRKWNPDFRCHLISLLNDWQKATDRKRLFWFGGLYDGRVQRRALDAMVFLYEREQRMQLPGLEAKLRCYRESWKPPPDYVEKWRPYRKYHNDVTLEGVSSVGQGKAKLAQGKGHMFNAVKAAFKKSKPVKKGGGKLAELLRKKCMKDLQLG